MNDLISVIIPTYNRGKLITKSIKSVLNQTYQNIEVIIVDDGSIDNTETVVKKIKDKRVKYYKYQNNKGACYARNYGIKKAKGKYIAFQDSDDIYHEDKLEKQILNMKKNNSDLDFCKICINDQNGHLIVPRDETLGLIFQNKYMEALSTGNFISTQAMLYKKSCLEKLLFDNELPRLQDYDIALRTANSYKISFTNEVLVELYRHGDNISCNHEKLEEALFLYSLKEIEPKKIKYEVVKNIYKEILREFSYELNMEYKNQETNYIKNIEKLTNQIHEEQSKNENLINKINDANSTIFDLNNRINELQLLYDNIRYSKRWNFINKLMKIFGK